MVGTVKSAYGFGVRIPAPFAEAVERTKAALKSEGFGILTEIDVKATMKQKLDVDFRPYVILGACNPPLAHRALEAELSIGLLLPCNVIVYADGDESVVEAMDPLVALDIADAPALAGVATEARQRLQAALLAVGS